MPIIGITLRLNLLLLTQRPLGLRVIIVLARLVIIGTASEQGSELRGLQKLEGTKDGTEHVTTQPQGVVDSITIDDAEEDEMGVDLVDLAGDLAEDVGDDTEDVVRIDLKHLSTLDQSVVVVDVRTDPLLHRLQLGQDLLRPHSSHHFRHLIDRIEEMPLDLKFRVDAE